MKYDSKSFLAIFALTACASSCNMADNLKEKNSGKEISTMTETLGGFRYYSKHRVSAESPLNLAGSLYGFENCSSAETYIKNRVLEDLEANFAQQKMAFLMYGTNKSSGPGTATPAMEGDTNTSAQYESGSSSSPSEFTTTNNQVEGVEEADFVKNDGKYIYTIANGRIQIAKSWPAEELSIIKTIKIEGYASALLLADTQLVVLSNPKFQDEEFCTAQNASYDSSYSYRCGRGAYDASKTEVLIYNVSDPSDPKLEKSYVLNGQYQNVRRIGQSLRLIIQSYLNYYSNDLIYYIDIYRYEQTSRELENSGPSNTFNGALMTEDEFDAAVVRAMEKNEEIIGKMTLSDFFSSESWYYYDSVGFGSLKNKKDLIDFGDCRKIHAPSIPAELGLTQVATINLSTGNLDLTSLLAQTSEIYASKDNLYLTTPYWSWFNWEQDRDYTFIHQMNISNSEEARYVGTGRIEGHIINQFAMDEHEGYLRVASTVTQQIPREKVENDTFPWERFNTKNWSVVFVLSPGEKQQLEVVGSAAAMVNDETIQSVRFSGDKGFVVTFRQTDPLFTLDLSDPLSPRYLGELKIPGFSSYLHMIDDSHLIGLGQGGTGGMKVSLFDVSDMENPVETDSYTLQNAYSEAQWNHKAFTWYASHKLLALPVASWLFTTNSYHYSSILQVLSIDAATGIKDAGSIDMADLLKTPTTEESYCWLNQSVVQRSLFADDFVYAISSQGIKVSNVNDVEDPVKSMPFEDQQDFDYSSCGYYMVD